MGVEVFGAVRALFRQRVAAKVADYKSLVKAVASGDKPPSPEEVVTILEGAGKTVENLEADVAIVGERKVWQAMLEEEPVLQKRLAEIARQKNAMNEDARRRVAAIEAENRVENETLQAELDRGNSRLFALGNAMPRARLIETSSLFGSIKAAREPVSGNVCGPKGWTHELLRAERDQVAADAAEANREFDKLKKEMGIVGSIGLGDPRDTSRLATFREKAGAWGRKLGHAEAAFASMDARVAAQRAKLIELEAAALAE